MHRVEQGPRTRRALKQVQNSQQQKPQSYIGRRTGKVIYIGDDKNDLDNLFADCIPKTVNEKDENKTSNEPEKPVKKKEKTKYPKKDEGTCVYYGRRTGAAITMKHNKNKPEFDCIDDFFLVKSPPSNDSSLQLSSAQLANDSCLESNSAPPVSDSNLHLSTDENVEKSLVRSPEKIPPSPRSKTTDDIDITGISSDEEEVDIDNYSDSTNNNHHIQSIEGQPIENDTDIDVKDRSRRSTRRAAKRIDTTATLDQNATQDVQNVEDKSVFKAPKGRPSRTSTRGRKQVNFTVRSADKSLEVEEDFSQSSDKTYLNDDSVVFSMDKIKRKLNLENHSDSTYTNNPIQSNSISNASQPIKETYPSENSFVIDIETEDNTFVTLGNKTTSSRSTTVHEIDVEGDSFEVKESTELDGCKYKPMSPEYGPSSITVHSEDSTSVNVESRVKKGNKSLNTQKAEMIEKDTDDDVKNKSQRIRSTRRAAKRINDDVTLEQDATQDVQNVEDKSVFKAPKGRPSRSSTRGRKQVNSKVSTVDQDVSQSSDKTVNDSMVIAKAKTQRKSGRISQAPVITDNHSVAEKVPGAIDDDADDSDVGRLDGTLADDGLNVNDDDDSHAPEDDGVAVDVHDYKDINSSLPTDQTDLADADAANNDSLVEEAGVEVDDIADDGDDDIDNNPNEETEVVIDDDVHHTVSDNQDIKTIYKTKNLSLTNALKQDSEGTSLIQEDVEHYKTDKKKQNRRKSFPKKSIHYLQHHDITNDDVSVHTDDMHHLPNNTVVNSNDDDSDASPVKTSSDSSTKDTSSGSNNKRKSKRRRMKTSQVIPKGLRRSRTAKTKNTSSESTSEQETMVIEDKRQLRNRTKNSKENDKSTGKKKTKSHLTESDVKTGTETDVEGDKSEDCCSSESGAKNQSKKRSSTDTINPIGTPLIPKSPISHPIGSNIIKSILKSSLPRSQGSDPKKRRVSIISKKKQTPSHDEIGDGLSTSVNSRTHRSSVSFAPTPSFRLAPEEFTSPEDTPNVGRPGLSFVSTEGSFIPDDKTFTPGNLSSASSTMSSMVSASTMSNTTNTFDVSQEVTISSAQRHHVEKEENEDGQRRSKRTKVRPLQYWKNERIHYKRRRSGWSVDGIQTVPTPKVPKRKKRNTNRKTNVSKKNEYDGYGGDDPQSFHNQPEDMEEVTCKPVSVINPYDGQEVDLDIIHLPRMLQFVNSSLVAAKPEDPILIDKYMSHNLFGIGQIILRPGAEKGMQHVRQDTMVFHVLTGQVQATVHQTTHLLPAGSTFFVPEGNCYNLKNTQSTDTRLYFVQIKAPQK